MIGVISKECEREVVEEFFQLFKTPWEFYDLNRSYEVVLSTTKEMGEVNAKLVMIYCSESTDFDANENIYIRSRRKATVLECDRVNIPIYGDAASLEGKGRGLIRLQDTSEFAGLKIEKCGQSILRVGYDIFGEILFLLTIGQPVANASVPTLERHILILRRWIVGMGIPLVEVRPVPAGYKMIVCLTHDVDFGGIRRHKFDRTVCGFIYRALIGSMRGFLEKRLSLRKVVKNWMAVLSLPLVYLGLLRDFWLDFDRYMELERGLRSTFFVIPFKHHAGDRLQGSNPKRRAAGYDISDIGEQVRNLILHGFEVGVHGIDAWHSKEKAARELDRINGFTEQADMGVRMHWLWMQADSFKILEEAGFQYDSTLGYNETIGFRCGTGGVFRPIGARTLLELPIHIQDTALLYPRRKDLSDREAWDLCKGIIDNIECFGGVLTLLWHQRSLAPERLWEDFYEKLLGELRSRRAWFSPAREVVSWFRTRRAFIFENAQFTGKNHLRLRLKSNNRDVQPPLVLRIHYPGCEESGADESSWYAPKHVDIPWSGENDVAVSF